jgi:hypothetical protein
MAVAAHRLLEAPETNAAELRVLVALVADADPLVARLAMVSATAVFKDIAPGYKIRVGVEEEGEAPGGVKVRRWGGWRRRPGGGGLVAVAAEVLGSGARPGGRAAGLLCSHWPRWHAVSFSLWGEQ